MDQTHHKGTSIVESLDHIDMVKQFPPDYLHIVLLGAMKKILRLLFSPVKPLLPIRYTKRISELLTSCHDFIPSEIHRKIRPLNELNLYHGNELRLFLLKIGPVILKNEIPSEFYINFLLLHVGISILCDESLCIEQNSTAEKLLHKFVTDSVNVYGNSFCVSVIHTCIHLAEAVRNQKAPLDSFSTFPFETFLTPIKKLIHSNNAPLQQIHRRLTELSFSESEKNANEKKCIQFIKTKDKYIAIKFNNTRISSLGSRDRFLLSVDNEILVCIKIDKCEDTALLTCRKLKILGDLYSVPISSRKLDIYLCETAYKDNRNVYDLSMFKRKMMGIPHNEFSMAFVPVGRF